jgi:hypothetical protein
MLDDDTLFTLFTQAAAALQPPESGPADILERAFGSPTAEDKADGGEQAAGPSPRSDEVSAARARRVTRTIKAHRLLSGVAAVLVALALAGGVSWLGSGSAKPKGTLASGVHASSRKSAANGGFGAIPTTTLPNVAAGAPLAPGTTSATGAGAAQQPAVSNSAPPASTATGGAPNSPAAVPQSVGQPARIEQSGSLSLTVPKGSLAKTMTQLNFLAGAYGGFVANSTTQSGPVAENGAPSGSITLEVPVASFSDVLKKAQALGKTVSLTTKATDVTAHYVDLQSQITALQASRQQYLTILAKATSIGDVLSVQAQLNAIDSQIQQLQGQLNVLSSETTYSSLSVTATEGIPAVHRHPAPRPHRSGLAAAWSDSVHGFVVGVEGLIKLAGPALFILLCGVALVLGGRLLWRRYQRHQL